MAISKAGKTGGAAGLSNYLIREKNAEIIGGNFFGTSREIRAQAWAWGRLHPDLRSNTLHLIESYAPGEAVSDEIINTRAEEKLKRLGLGGCPFLIVKHTDKDHYVHAHILAIRILIDGTVVGDSNLALRAIQITKDLDRELGMQETPFYFRAKRTGRKEYEMMKRTGAASSNETLCNMIDRAAQKSENIEAFLTNLERGGIGFRLTLNDEQNGIKGISFDCQKTGHTRGIKGSELGDGFSFPALKRRIGYNEGKDFPKLAEKYDRRLKSELQPDEKKSNRKETQEAYVLVSRSFQNANNSADDSVVEPNSFQAIDINELTQGNLPQSEDKKGELQPVRNTSKTEFLIPKEKTNANDLALAERSPATLASDITQTGARARNEETFATEPEPSMSDGDKVKIGQSADETSSQSEKNYLKFSQVANKDTELDSARETSRIVISLQSKISLVCSAAESYTGFLRELHDHEIICLPEVDEQNRVSDFVFITDGVIIPSSMLNESYQFAALTERMSYPDRPVFAAPELELSISQNFFEKETAESSEQSIPDFLSETQDEADQTGQVTVDQEDFLKRQLAGQHDFSSQSEMLENPSQVIGTGDMISQNTISAEQNTSQDVLAEMTESLSRKIPQTDGREEDIVLATNESTVEPKREVDLLSKPILALEEDNRSAPISLPINEIIVDETFAEFQSIFQSAGLEDLLESKNGAAEFETIGEKPARYEIAFSAAEIKFYDFDTVSDNSNSTAENCRLTFKRNETGNFQLAANFSTEPTETRIEETAAQISYDDASKVIHRLKDSGFAENVIVTRLTIENDKTDEIKRANQLNAERHVSRQLGQQLLAEMAHKTAEHNQIQFRESVNQTPLKVAVDLGNGIETRNISPADLQRERGAMAQSQVFNAKKAGILKMVVKDEGISLQAAEEKQYRRELSKAQALQKPWIQALEKAQISETARLKEATSEAHSQVDAEKGRSDLLVKKTRIDNAFRLKPVLDSEAIWAEQIKAIKRADTKTFSELEEMHKENGLPRPNSVYAELRGLEMLARVNVTREKKISSEQPQAEQTEAKILLNVKRENGKLTISDWRSKKDGEQKIKMDAKLTDLESIADYPKYINPYLNPISALKSDNGLQIVRAVAQYIEQNDKAKDLAHTANLIVKPEEVTGQDHRSGKIPNFSDSARLHEVLYQAIDAEESRRENLRLNSSFSAKLLETPKPQFSKPEIEQLGLAAMEISDAESVQMYIDSVKHPEDSSKTPGEAEKRLAVKALFAEAYAVNQSNQAIENINLRDDGSIDTVLNLAQLAAAVESVRTADEFDKIQVANSEKSLIDRLSLEEISRISRLLDATHPVVNALDERAHAVANNQLQNLQPPLNSDEQAQLKSYSLKPEFYNRTAQISAADNYYNQMAQEAETGTQNQIAFQQTAQNFSVINPSKVAEKAEENFWKNDRRQRESELAHESDLRRQSMTDDQKAAEDGEALEQAIHHENSIEQEQGGLTQK